MSTHSPITSTQLRVAIGWKPLNSGVEPDIDLSVFMLSPEGKLPDTAFFVFYNNLESLDLAVKHLGDAPTSKGEGDQELLQIDLGQVDARIQSMLFVVTIHEAEKYQHHFGMIQGAYIRLMDDASGTELLRYDLSADFAHETAIAFARFARTQEGWVFESLGRTEPGGLSAFVALYN